MDEPGVLLFVGGLIVAGILTGISNLRTRRAFIQQRDRSLGEARGEASEQLGQMATAILELTDRIRVAGDDAAERLFAEAAAAYSEAQDDLERARTLPELERVSDDLDHARWQLEAARARLEGRELQAGEPEHDRACFFDPTHGAGTDPATIDTPAGRREVRVCSYCATKLRSGQTPQPRMINVGGRQVPAAKAPRSHGGGGLEWLDDFSVVFGDARLPYGWGRYGPRRRGGRYRRS